MACDRKETHAGLKMQRACMFLCVCLCPICYLGRFFLTDVWFAIHVFLSLLTVMTVLQEQLWVLDLKNNF